MQHLLLLNVLLFTFISITVTYPCSSSTTSDCCCCRRGNRQWDCCSRRNDECNSRCPNDRRDCVDCSRRDISCCSTQECNQRCPNDRRDCDDCCPTPPNPNPTPPNPNPPNTTPPNPNPPNPIPPTPPSIPPQPNTSHYSNNTNISGNNNTITIPTNINIQNEVRSETRITIPVSIKVDTVNTINIKQEESNTSNSSNVKCDNTTIIVDGKNCTEQVVTVPVPIYRPIPVPYIVTVPRPVPVPQGCCQVVSPCSPYSYGGCQRSSTQCSQDCSDVYQPADVCGTGCYRRSTAMGGYCGHGGCYRRQVDCGTCDGRFFENYESFVRCSGCFVPRPWDAGN